MSAKIYTKDECLFCVKAKMLMNSREMPFVEIDAVDNKAELIDIVTSLTGKPPKTVPQIFISDIYVGGYDQLKDYFAKMDYDSEDGS